jgi:hypothetical protein
MLYDIFYLLFHIFLLILFSTIHLANFITIHRVWVCCFQHTVIGTEEGVNVLQLKGFQEKTGPESYKDYVIRVDGRKGYNQELGGRKIAHDFMLDRSGFLYYLPSH